MDFLRWNCSIAVLMACFEMSAESKLYAAPSNQPITFQAFIFINQKSFHRKILKYLCLSDYYYQELKNCFFLVPVSYPSATGICSAVNRSSSPFLSRFILTCAICSPKGSSEYVRDKYLPSPCSTSLSCPTYSSSQPLQPDPAPHPPHPVHSESA